jgi:hypothetical protein
MAREWSYWTRNKLEILAKYLPAFTTASRNEAGERICLDLMAGQPKNVERHTGDGLREVLTRVGKETAGRELDGRTWDQFPRPDGGRASA